LGLAPSGAEFVALVGGEYREGSYLSGVITRFETATIDGPEQASGQFVSRWGTGRNRESVDGAWTYARTGPDTALLSFTYLLYGTPVREEYHATFHSPLLAQGTYRVLHHGSEVERGNFSQLFAKRPTRVEEEIDFTTPLTTQVGESVEIPFAGSAIPDGAQVLGVRGLPPGLRYDAASQTIVGQASRAGGARTATVQYLNEQGKRETAQFQVAVSALPASATGNFTGLVEPGEPDQGLGGMLTISVNASGAATGNLQVGGQNLRFRGQVGITPEGFDARLAVEIPGRGPVPTIHVDLLLGIDGEVYGQVVAQGFAGAEVRGWRQAWSKDNPVPANRQGQSNLLMWLAAAQVGDPDIPQGSGFAVLQVNAGGAGRLAGRLGDGTRLAASLPLGVGGQVGATLPLYRGTGSVRIEANQAANGEVNGTAHWVRLGQWWNPRERLYAQGFGEPPGGPVLLEVAGAKWQPGVSGLVGGVLQFEPGFTASFGVDGRGRVLVNEPNPARVRLTYQARTGALGGSFELRDPNPERPATLVRKANFFGLVVPGAIPQAEGFYLVPELANPPFTTGRTSPIQSGLFQTNP
jgi:hypothetical protein